MVRVVGLVENQILAALSDVQVREPAHVPEAPPLLPVLVNPVTASRVRVVVGNLKFMSPLLAPNHSFSSLSSGKISF